MAVLGKRVYGDSECKSVYKPESKMIRHVTPLSLTYLVHMMNLCGTNMSRAQFPT